MATPLKRHAALHHLAVTVPVEAEDAASAILEERFGLWPASFTEPEGATVELSLFLQPDRKPAGAELAGLNVQLQRLARHGLPVHGLRIRMRRLAGRDWRQSWKRHFRPLAIGRRLLLRPSWSRRRAVRGQAVVVLDPGLSFGTGQHPTTAFCLRELVRARHSSRHQSFLDIGTGSGILAIAAAKLRYQPVRGIDLDPESIRVAKANSRRNRVSRRVRFQEIDLAQAPLRRGLTGDVVCANLLADLLLSQCDRILSSVRPGGVLVIAGILAREFEEVDRAYVDRGLRRMRARLEGEWQSASYRVPA